MSSSAGLLVFLLIGFGIVFVITTFSPENATRDCVTDCFQEHACLLKSSFTNDYECKTGVKDECFTTCATKQGTQQSTVYPYVQVVCADKRTHRSCEWTTSQECWDRECKNLKDEDRTFDGIQGMCADGTRYECQDTSKKECEKKNCEEPPAPGQCSQDCDWTLINISHNGKVIAQRNVTCKEEYCTVKVVI